MPYGQLQAIYVHAWAIGDMTVLHCTCAVMRLHCACIITIGDMGTWPAMAALLCAIVA